MPFDGSGNFNRVHNFSADASAGIQAQATRFDADLDGIATGLENCQTLTGETTPIADSPMGGFKHTGVAAATSTDNYLRSDQSSNQIGIYVRDTNTSVTGIISASAAVFPTAFTDGQRVTVKVSADGSTSAPRAIIVNGLSANIIDNEGSAVLASKMKKDGIFDLIYDSSASAFRSVTPRNDNDFEGLFSTEYTALIATSAEVNAGVNAVKLVTPFTLAGLPGTAVIKTKTADKSLATNITPEDDNHLIGWNLVTDKRYLMEGYLIYAQDGGKLRMVFQFSNVAEFSEWSSVGIDTVPAESFDHAADMTTDLISSTTDAVAASVRLKGTFQANSSAGGTLDFQWAQQISDADNTTVQNGSWIRIQQMD